MLTLRDKFKFLLSFLVVGPNFKKLDCFENSLKRSTLIDYLQVFGSNHLEKTAVDTLNKSKTLTWRILFWGEVHLKLGIMNLKGPYIFPV
jgi:hypothetical protein